MEMSAYQDLQVPAKLKRLKWLAASSACLGMGALFLTLYAMSMASGAYALLCIMGMHAGIYVASQWVRQECKAVETHIQLYSLDQSGPVTTERTGLVYQLPMLSLSLAFLSFLMLI